MNESRKNSLKENSSKYISIYCLFENVLSQAGISFICRLTFRLSQFYTISWFLLKFVNEKFVVTLFCWQAALKENTFQFPLRI